MISRKGRYNLWTCSTSSNSRVISYRNSRLWSVRNEIVGDKVSGFIVFVFSLILLHFLPLFIHPMKSGGSFWLNSGDVLFPLMIHKKNNRVATNGVIPLMLNTNEFHLFYALFIPSAWKQQKPRWWEEVKWNWILRLRAFESFSHCFLEGCLLIPNLELVGCRIGFFLDRSHPFAFHGGEPVAAKRAYSPYIKNRIVSIFHPQQVDSM